MMIESEVASRLAGVRDAIQQAATRAGRENRVALVAVTKSIPAELVGAAYEAGQRVFGENRVQEGARKIFAAGQWMPDAEWHLIGHLQRNKVRAAVDLFSLIESVDSLPLARRLDQASASGDERCPILLEVNVAGEPSKQGFAPADLPAVVREMCELPNLALRGLMTVAPLTEDAEDIRWVFRRLRELRDELREAYDSTDFVELSMGMSGDFPVAIEEGATMVRIGRAIFGDRPTG